MGVYIGTIEKRSSFFNFKPLAEIHNSQVISLTPEDLESLLPESEKRNIYLFYNWKDEQESQCMNEHFPDNALVIFEFTLSDLQPNFKSNGDRNQTGYKVTAMDMLNDGKIRSIGEKDNVYFIVQKDDILSDFINDNIVEIDPPCQLTNYQVFVEVDDFWAGPYEVEYRNSTSSYYIKPQIKEHKYTINGYGPSNVEQFELISQDGYWEISETKWMLLCPNPNAEIEQLDVISDSELINSFKDSIESDIITNGSINLDDINTLIKQYKDSELMGSILKEETRLNRLSRLKSILTSETDIDNTLHTVTDFICDLLIKYKDSSNVEEWLKALFEKHPEFFNKVQDIQTISKRITDLNNELDDLTEQHDSLKQEIEVTRQRAESLDQQAIEAKKKTMLEQEEKYASLSAQIEASEKILGVVANIDNLQKKYDDIKKEVDYLDSHKEHLATDATSLELQFQQLISRQHDKMVEISFDGFMSNKMLQAAAEWEAEQSDKQHMNFTNKITDIPVQNKKPDELIEYLCRVVHVCRPNYSKNTIINIAICMTQGFLTVFSGEPGCGKTSICNIMGEVLGLNKISDMIDCPEDSKESVNRYLAVSVERGWTSKRDFVGYYNPLSKTFDKSNRRIYDALHQLDTEKRTNKSKLPYVILLDEANLSPMEYYWSDFMNICDDLGQHSKVNLGENYVFGIPETLHFVATINNDHTTETLSPRLIDRAWIITLPQLTLRDYSSAISNTSIPSEQIEVISWMSLRDAFMPTSEDCTFPSDIQKCYESIITKLREENFSVSPRIDAAIKRYWNIASRYFEMDDTKTAPTTIALDYAIAQRILPKIIGNGEEFENWLKEFENLCSKNELNMCAAMLKNIRERGNQQMKYYQFFC